MRVRRRTLLMWRFPARRRAAAITAWMIIPAGLGWLVLTARLLGGS